MQVTDEMVKALRRELKTFKPDDQLRSALTAALTAALSEQQAVEVKPGVQRMTQAADAYVAEEGIEHSGGIVERAFEAGAVWAFKADAVGVCPYCAEDHSFVCDYCKDTGRMSCVLPDVRGRWRVIEAATAPGYWGIELEDADNDDDAILYPQKIHRDTVTRIVEAHNAAQHDCATRIRSALVDVPAVEPVGDDLIGYVLRYGGMCRDCADMDGVCQSGQPCDTEQRRAVIKHTVAALAYGIKHGFIANPFASPPLSREGEDSAEVEPTHRHKKRGSEYVLIGIGKMQAEDWSMQTLGQDDDGRNAWVHESVDMREVAIYRSVDDGSLWVRPREEFEDGRFELIDAINAKGGE